MRVFARFEVRSPGSGQKRGNICRASEILVKGAFLPVPVSREGGALRAPPPPPPPPPRRSKKIAGLPLYPTPVPCGVRASTEPGPGRGRRGPKKMSSEKIRDAAFFRVRKIKIVGSCHLQPPKTCEKCEKMAALPGGRFFLRARHVYRAASRPSPPCTGSRRY